jgi:hypothetical protein
VPLGAQDIRVPTLKTGGRGNSAGFFDAEVNRLLDAAEPELDSDARARVYREAQRIGREQALWIFLSLPQDIYGVSRRIVNWRPQAAGRSNHHRARLTGRAAPDDGIAPGRAPAADVTAVVRHQHIRCLLLLPSPPCARSHHDAPHRFSGRMEQGAKIAIALARRPRLLVADEPTTALLFTLRAQVIDLLDRLRGSTSCGRRWPRTRRPIRARAVCDPCADSAMPPRARRPADAVRRGLRLPRPLGLDRRRPALLRCLDLFDR